MIFNKMALIWGIIAISTLILEVGHPGLFVFLSICIGSLGAVIAAMLEYSLAWQILIFSGSLFIGLALIKYRLNTYNKSFKKAQMANNMYALIGKQARVINVISFNNPGYVKIDGEVWLAKLLNIHKENSINKNLNINTSVRVVGVKGCHLIVEEVNINTKNLNMKG